jgi:hypothetical protein
MLALGGFLTFQHSEVVQRAWRSWVASPGAAPADATGRHPRPEGEEEADDLEPVPPDPAAITLRVIEGLMRSRNYSAALIQARIWQEALRDLGVPADDRRLVRLEQVIQVLARKLTPPPKGPPPYVAKFRDLVQSLADQLKAKDVEAARQAAREAEQLLEAHAEELGSHSRRYLMLNAKLREEELLLEGAERIRSLLRQTRGSLEQADQLLDHSNWSKAADKVTESLESEARAKYLAWVAPLTEQEQAEFDQTVRRLIPELRLARGKRAVADARRCADAGDLRARDQAIARARARLPGLPGSQIQRWLDDAEKISLMSGPQQANSTVGNQIEVRERYERVLEHYGTGDHAKVVDACLEAAQLLAPTQRESGSLHDKLGQLALEVLEPTITRLLAPLVGQASDAEVAQAVEQARGSLGRLTAWRTNPRWKVLNGAIGKKAGQLGEHIIQRASELAEEDKLAEAIAEVAPAERVGDPAIADRAKDLRQKCQAELELRASLQAQTECWRQIDRLRQDGNELQAWREVGLFIRRFPDSPRNAHAADLRGQLQATLQQKAEVQLDESEQRLQEKNWSEFYDAFAALEPEPLSPTQRTRWEKLKHAREELQQRAAGAFLLLEKSKPMTLKSDVLALMEGLPKVLELDPKHSEAAELLQQSRQRGRQWAEKDLKAAAMWKLRIPEKYPARLEEVIRLDPAGPHGASARRLLDELKRRQR